ncbi:MAG: hypothetical protein Q8M98_03985 [Candidatus Cloacimonadaceae bacterium]|nr:hypothetical protein [Candidatus Cloacimonadaceae bacterium]MDP3113918.1 hypothetical protein [Candidatus Cloacimonadaceae bacterium]
MKASPKEIKIMQKMQPGTITLSGFLGNDKRTLNEIIEDDFRLLNALEFTPEEIADRMQYFTDKSWNAFTDEVLIDDIYQVETEVVRGKLPCPFGHVGIYRKAITKFTNTRKNISLSWTSLNIHLIRAHGFFEGKGSSFRLEPAELVNAIFDR